MYKTTWLDEWMAEYGDRLIRFCWSYTQDPHVAEDLVQETFLRLWEPFRKIHLGNCMRAGFSRSHDIWPSTIIAFTLEKRRL